MNSDNKIYEIDDHGNEKEVKEIFGIKINFLGSGSRVYVHKNTDFQGCHFVCGERMTIRIGKTRHHVKKLLIAGKRSSDAQVLINDKFSCVGCTINMNESASVSIGNDCMFSYNITIWTADGHTIFDTKTLECLNKAKNIIIDDHVWIGQGVQIMKGSNIQKNSIIGSGSLVSKVFKDSEVVIAGVPAKIIKNGVNWSRQSPENYIKNQNLTK